MTADPSDLTTIAAVSAYLGQDPALDAGLLQSLVTAESDRIQAWLGYAVASAPYLETRCGNGKRVMVLANGPVTAVTTLLIEGHGVPALETGVPCGYAFDAHALYLTGRVFTPGWRNVSIAYTAGYTTIPPDLAQATVELVALRYRLCDKAGLISEAAMQQTTAYVQADMPQSVAAAIEPYRKRAAVSFQ